MSFEVVASFPSFQILSPKTSGLSTAFPAGVRLIHINVPSDGNPDHLPTDKAQKKADPPTLYLEKCGHIWGKTYRLDNAYTYYLQALPHGYTFWQKSRPGNPRQVDGWLYGHPRRKRFTSPNEFFTHLHYLTENNGISIGCPCRQCVGPTGVLGPLRAGTGSISTSSESTPSVQQVTISAAATPVLESAASSPAPNLKRKPGRPPKNAESALAPTSGTTASHSQFKDEEGTPDVVQGLFHKLERDGQCDQDIDEKLSPDFEALRLPLKDWQEQTAAQPAWAPRAGEIVLFVRDINAKCTISYENSTAAFKLYDYTKKRFLGFVDTDL